MSDDFNFAPAPRVTAKKRKRSQTAPMIASIVTPAVVMIGFLVYLDQKGFFSPPKQTAAVAAKAEYKPRIEKDSKHFPAPAKRPREVPPWGPLVDNPAPRAAAPIAEPEPIGPAAQGQLASGKQLPAKWDLELPLSKEVLRSSDVDVAMNQLADPLGKHPAVWVYEDHGAPAVCFALGSRKSRRPGLNEPVWHGTALAVGDTRHPPIAVDYQHHKRHGWFRLLSKQGDTEALVSFENGNLRGIAAVCEAGALAYLRDVQDSGKTVREYFVSVAGELVTAVPIDRKDAPQVERAGTFHRRLLEALGELDAREVLWRRAFTTWDTRCEDEITAAAKVGGKQAGEKKISDLRAEQDHLRDSLLGGR